MRHAAAGPFFSFDGHPQDAFFNFPHKQAVTSSGEYGIVGSHKEAL